MYCMLALGSLLLASSKAKCNRHSCLGSRLATSSPSIPHAAVLTALCFIEARVQDMCDISECSQRPQ